VERFQLIEAMEEESYTRKELCRTLEVSRSGYYAHSRKPEGLRRRQDADLKEQIEETFRESRHDHPIAPNRLLPA